MMTPMMIRELWQALESETSVGLGSSGWMLRLAKPRPNCPLFIAVELSSRRRAIFLQLPASSVPPQRHWPHCRGLDTAAQLIGREIYFGVILKELLFTDVFTALAEDLARRVEVTTGDPRELATVFISQLNRWQKFLSSSHDGLGNEQQQGLWGELHLLRTHLLPNLGPNAALCWKGGKKAHQDFQFERGAVEVKTTLARQPQLIRISSERQLDSTGWDALFLHIVALEVRDSGGETLPALVASLRSAISNNTTATEAVEDGLLAYGYFDSHAEQYLNRSYFSRAETTYQVKRGFPRIIEEDLPHGVGEVSYGLSINALEPFLIDKNAAIAQLQIPVQNYNKI